MQVFPAGSQAHSFLPGHPGHVNVLYWKMVDLDMAVMVLGTLNKDLTLLAATQGGEAAAGTPMRGGSSERLVAASVC